MKKVFAIAFVFIGAVGLSLATCCVPSAPPAPPPVILTPSDASAPVNVDAAAPSDGDAAICAFSDAASDAGPTLVPPTSPRVCVARADIRELCAAVRPFCAP